MQLVKNNKLTKPTCQTFKKYYLMYRKISNDKPGSKVHREQRWKEYQERKGTWAKKRWDKVYDANMLKAQKAHKAVNQYHKHLGGWGRREVTVEVDGLGQKRRFDIADEVVLQGIEYKTGYQYADESNLLQIHKDAKLIEAGWEIKWVFTKMPSKPLQQALHKANISFEMRGDSNA